MKESENIDIDKLINESFESSCEFKLTDNFADKVTLTIIKREQFKSDLIEYFQICTAFISLFAIVAGFYLYIDKGQLMNALKIFTDNSALSIMIILAVNFIVFIDRVLLRILFDNYKGTILR